MTTTPTTETQAEARQLAFGSALSNPTVHINIIAQRIQELKDQVTALIEQGQAAVDFANAQITALQSQVEQQRALMERDRAALQAMLNHSGVADAPPEDKLPEDHEAESRARSALKEAGS